jgi:hypothetical protein
VGGVAEDEDVVAPPAVGQLRPERVLGDPDDLQPLGRDAFHPWPQQRVEARHRAEISGGFAAKKAELPPVPRLSDPHERGRAMRVAYLLHAVPLVEVGASRDIDDEPTLLKLQVFQTRTDRGAHHAVGAVATEQVVRLDVVLATAYPVGVSDPDALRIDRRDVGHLRVGPQRGVRISLEIRPQQRLQFGLVEHVRPRESVNAFGCVAAELCEHAHVPVAQLQAAGGP